MTFNNKNLGFTLAELLVAMVISSIILAIMYATYQAQLRSQITQQLVVEMQQNARAVMYAMEREIRLAGYDPTESGNARITSAQIGSITFTMDINNGVDDDGDGIIDEFDEIGMPNTDGDVLDNSEEITYHLSNDLDEDGIADSLNCNLLREHWDGAATQSAVIAQNIDALNFVYLDGSGVDLIDYGLAPPSVPVGQLADIRSVQITTVARAGQAALNALYKLSKNNPDDKTYTNQQGAVILPAPNDRYRRIVLSTDIKCRNLGS
jgi:type IV pilus assembly protein PilW